MSESSVVEQKYAIDKLTVRLSTSTGGSGQCPIRHRRNQGARDSEAGGWNRLLKWFAISPTERRQTFIKVMIGSTKFEPLVFWFSHNLAST